MLRIKRRDKDLELYAADMLWLLVKAEYDVESLEVPSIRYAKFYGDKQKKLTAQEIIDETVRKLRQ